VRHPATRTLPDEPIEPTYTPLGMTVEVQREILCELRQLQNAIPAAQLQRDDRLTSLALSGTVTRKDMARACGLNKSRIDQIIAAHAHRIQAIRNAAAEARMRRHMP
jgi:hypothetical protein